MIEVVDLCPQA